MARQDKPATLRTTEVAALEKEVSRYRAALENLRSIAGVMAVAADGSTEAVGLAYLGRLASDALEGA